MHAHACSLYEGTGKNLLSGRMQVIWGTEKNVKWNNCERKEFLFVRDKYSHNSVFKQIHMLLAVNSWINLSNNWLTTFSSLVHKTKFIDDLHCWIIYVYLQYKFTSIKKMKIISKCITTSTYFFFSPHCVLFFKSV